MNTYNTTKIDEIRDLYFDLLKLTLANFFYGEEYSPIFIHKFTLIKRMFYTLLIKQLGKKNILLVNRKEFDPELRKVGKGHPLAAYTMIGLERLTNIEFCAKDVISNNIPGDFVETGIWRGGAIIFMRAILKAYGIVDRDVWGADSFQGLPSPDPEKYPEDAGDTHSTMLHLAVSLDSVKENFNKFGLLDKQVHFLEGWFKDTLPVAPIKEIALLRLDGDMYESTMDALVHLYPKLSRGGFIIIDDYGYIESCRKAVTDYRNAYKINDEIKTIDWSGVYWQKTT